MKLAGLESDATESFSATAAAVVQAYERQVAVRQLEAEFEREVALSGRWRVDRSEDVTKVERKGIES